MWAVWSNEHDMWWKSNGAGYTSSLTCAGVYSKIDAQDIERRAQVGDEKAMPLSIAVMFELGRMEALAPRDTVGRLMLAALDRLYNLVNQ